ncbi:aldo/keto reductase [Chitinophaga horti]|uniref:Aldo/keto reductase n=1 Tax=Chitinophaga horti TaxID=2920382 RepID=A0ABY6J777_9BACT|nr:aldo/keto reductase [Chitinophaga horti]UYQ95526.1 aldo/keto reductase [Chitinophaga horti]
MSNIEQRKLGSQGLTVSQIGLGCMGMTVFTSGMEVYGASDESEAIATLHRSLELGVSFLDTADTYGPNLNERLIAKAVAGKRHRYTIATKFGYEIDADEQLTWQINGKKSYVKSAVERSLRALNTDYIDLYYMHRLDPNTPIEETVGAMSDLVKEGKVKYIGLSEVGSDTIRRAHAVHPVTALQSEYSIFERSIEEEGIIDTLNQLGIGLVAYSPLGRGYLTGSIQREQDLPPGDFRRNMPRFQGDQLMKNVTLANALGEMAKEKGISPAQLAVAWVLANGHVPIPGTRKVKNLEQNVAAAAVKLSMEDMRKLESIVPIGAVHGERYDATSMSIVGK